MLLHSDPQSNFSGSNGDYRVNCVNLPMLLFGSCVIIPGHLCKFRLIIFFSYSLLAAIASWNMDGVSAGYVDPSLPELCIAFYMQLLFFMLSVEN